MKKNLSIISVFIILTLTYFFVSYSETSENAKNAKKIKIGDKSTQVFQIMGKPKWEGIEKFDTVVSKHIFYEPPFGSSSGIDFYIDVKGDTVIKIINFDSDTLSIEDMKVIRSDKSKN